MFYKLAFPHVFSLSISICLGVFGQLQLKLGAGQLDFSSLNGLLYGNRNLYYGILLYGVSLIFYIIALKQLPLSIAFPAVSISYVAVALIAHYFLQEPINGMQVFGLTMIMIGVSCLGVAKLI